MDSTSVSLYHEADAQAACDNANLPRQGFTIMQVVPNTRGKDCYWQRSGQPSSPDNNSQATLESAIRASRTRQQNSLREIEQSRNDGWTIFWRHFNGCGGEPPANRKLSGHGLPQNEISMRPWPASISSF